MMSFGRVFSLLTAPVSRRTGPRLRDQSGSVLIIVSVSMVVLLGMAGLALDMGRGYVTRARLVRAIDAGVLTGARTLRKGQTTAEQQAFAVAAANGFVDGQGGVSLGIGFSKNAEGEQTVTMSASQPMPTVLMHLLGKDELMISAVSAAAVPPVDLVLVLDQSGSLSTVGAFDELQYAARSFVDYFDDQIDQMGLVSFQLVSADRHVISHGFRSDIKNEISNMSSAGYTNYGEGLRLAYEQIKSPNVRKRSAKVVVFFTDGRPTAFRGDGKYAPLIGGNDRVMAIRQVLPINGLAGYWDKSPDALLIDGDNGGTNKCRTSPQRYTCPEWTELTSNRKDIIGNDWAHDSGRYYADLIRAEGVLVYSIGLGNTAYSDPAFQPNQAFLSELANVGGSTKSSQPPGRFYFAPSAFELEAVFNQVAQDLLVRLSR